MSMGLGCGALCLQRTLRGSLRGLCRNVSLYTYLVNLLTLTQLSNLLKQAIAIFSIEISRKQAQAGNVVRLLKFINMLKLFTK